MWRPKSDNLFHEILLTEFLLYFVKQLPEAEIKRGKHTDRILRPDATVVFKQTLHVELDTGTEGYRQAKSRFQAYTNDPVIWVALTEARMEGLRKRAKIMRHTALFTVLGTRTLKTYDGAVVTVDQLCGQTSAVSPHPSDVANAVQAATSFPD